MNKRKINFIKITTFLFGSLLLLQNCEKDYNLQKVDLYEGFKINAETVSVNQAKDYFNVKKTTFNREMNSSFKVIPDWNTVEQSEIAYSNALLTLVKVRLNITGNYNSKLLFVKVNNEIRNVVFTIIKHKTTPNGNILDATLYFNRPNGKFIDAFKVKDGFFTNRIVYKEIKRINQASFLSFYQECEGQMDASFIGERYIRDSSGDPCMVGSPTHLGTFSSGQNNYDPVDPSYQNFINNVAYNQDASSNISNTSDTGSNLGGGMSPSGLNNAVGVILTYPPIESDLSGNCPVGYSKNQLTGDCDYMCSEGKVYNIATQNCECPEGKTEDSKGNCLDLPTPCETAFLSRDVYNTMNGQQELGTKPIPNELSGGWELNTTLDTSAMTLTQNSSGYNSAVYQKLVNGEYQYMYVTEGSTFEGVQDWINNIKQLSGNSLQYEISVKNAEILSNLVGSKQLYFVGHSLGGGLASVNSLATGRTAFTYNAAGLSEKTRNLYNKGLTPQINATVVKGEILDRIQSEFDIKAEDSNQINYIEEESTYWQDFFNERSPAFNLYKSARLHTINAIIDILDCEE